jgi:outer membrane protein assembly factor BamB
MNQHPNDPTRQGILASRRIVRSFLVASFLIGAASRAPGGDWPQILGPARNGQAQDEQLTASWPGGGPRIVWQHDVGSGLAGPAVVRGRVVIFHRRGDELIAECLDAASGKQHWQVAFATRYESGISPDNGPRCVPLVAGERVYLLGPAGELQCVELNSGKRVWFRNVFEDFQAPDGYFGAGSSPILEDDKLLLNVGGKKGGLVALSPLDGKTIWTATDELASYSSPVAVTIGGTRHVLFVTRLNVVSVDPTTGAVRFRFPFGSRGPTVNAANPLILGDHLFVSASYGVGAQWVRIGRDAATQEWESDKVMSSQYTTSVEKDGQLYGIDGRQDVGRARLRAFDPRTAKVHWTQNDFGTGNLILADNKLLIMKTDGELLLVEPTTARFNRLASAKLFDATAQALAALSDGLLFVRDTRTLKCVEVGSRKSR